MNLYVFYLHGRFVYSLSTNLNVRLACEKRLNYQNTLKKTVSWISNNFLNILLNSKELFFTIEICKNYKRTTL